MANDPNEKKLPWPEESDPAKLGDEFADTTATDRHAIAESFADPNALDDQRIGKNFVETNSSAKKKHKPLKDVIHKPKSKKPIWIIVGIVLGLFVLVLLIGGLPKLFTRHEIDNEAKNEKSAKPTVMAAKVKSAGSQAGLALPGTTIPLNEAYVYARASGYLQSLKVDIGDHVRKGQLLATIDAPDLDAQVDQAKQQVKQAEQQLEQQKSQLALATVTVQRYRVLVTKGVFSRQQGDQQEATYASELANVAAAQRNVEAYKANLDRVKSLQSYEQVRSPMDGVVTQRNVDIGALISAGGSTSGASSAPAPQGQTSSNGGTAQAGQGNSAGSSGSISTAATPAQSPGQGGPLFGIAQVEKLRVLVSVPEGYAPFIHPGGKAQLAFQEYPGVPFEGVVTRTSNSVDQNTRTMLSEIQVDNKDGKLISGMYVVATFPPEPGLNAPLIVKGDAVVVRNDHSTVALVQNGKIHIVPVVLGRDFGDSIELLNGVKAGDLIVTNVTDDVVDGAEVQVKVAPEEAPEKPESQATPPGGSTRYSNQALTDKNLQGQQQKQNQQSQGKGQGEQQKSSQSESKP